MSLHRCGSHAGDVLSQASAPHSHMLAETPMQTLNQQHRATLVVHAMLTCPVHPSRQGMLHRCCSYAYCCSTYSDRCLFCACTHTPFHPLSTLLPPHSFPLPLFPHPSCW
jgi:hypothetical protein